MAERPASNAIDAFRMLMDDFFERVGGVAPTVKRQGDTLQLGRAQFRWSVQPHFVPEGAFPECGWDVVAGVTIGIVQDGNPDYRGRGAMVRFTDIGSGRDFRP